MPDIGAWIYGADGTRRRKGRADKSPNVVVETPPVERPTGPGYYAIEDLGVGMNFFSARNKVKTLAAGTRPDNGTSHKTLTLPGTREAPFYVNAPGFTEGASGQCGFLLDGGISYFGGGPEATILRVAPDSITQADVDAFVPPIDNYPNNIALRLAVVSSASNLRFENMGFQGTQQRVNGTGTQGSGWDTYHYTGLSLSSQTNVILRNVKVWSIPGYRNSPPGETAHIAVIGGSGQKFYDVETDGRRSWGDGSKIGGAGISTSSVANITLTRCKSHHMGFSHGFAFWQTGGITGDDCISTDNGGGQSASLGGTAGDGFNFERSRNSLLRRPIVGNNTLCELRYYGRNDGDAYDGDTFPHRVEDLTLTEGALDIRIDNIQTTLPTLVNCPTPVYDIN